MVASSTTASADPPSSAPVSAGHVIVHTIPVENYQGTGNFGIFHKNLFNFGGSFVTTDSDFYRIDLSAGQPIKISTTTPADASGEFVNTLDPVLELYDAAGNKVATDDNSAPDGRNALLSYTAATGGAYYIKVRSASGSGEYVLNLPPSIAVSVPANANETAGSVAGTVSVATPPASDLTVTLTSSDPARLTVPASVVIPAGQLSVPISVSILDNNLLDGAEPVTIGASAPGFGAGGSIVTIHDDETATLTVTIPGTAGL